MSTQLQDLISQRDALARQIESAKSAVRADAISQVRQLMSQHGLTVADLSGKAPGRAGPTVGKSVAPKYRDPVSGATWSGRGLKPRWLAEALRDGTKSLNDYAIEARG